MISKDKLQQIKLLLLDMDGVLTDGSIYISDSGEQMRRFHAHDGQGIKYLQKSGIYVGIITGSKQRDIIEIRCKMLGISEDLTSIATSDKLEVVNDWTQRLGISLSEVAYIGDDLPDIEVMESVGISACPSDALSKVQAIATLVLEKEGGRGCVRELIDMILEAQEA